MTKKRRKKNFSYLAGERGRNRVRAYQQARDGRYYLEFMEAGRRTSVTIPEVTDPEEAKRMADELAAKLTRHTAERGATLDTLLYCYLKEKTPTKQDSKQRHDRRAAGMFRAFFGAQAEPERRGSRDPESLDRIDWDRFIEARRKGRIPGWARTVGDRQVEYDLKFLLAVLNWAVGARLIQANPWRPEIRTPQKWEMPRELNPMRPSMSDDVLEGLIRFAPGWQFEAMMRLGGETGRRNNSIRQLRWSDVDFTNERIRWRHEADKTGKESSTYMPKSVEVILRGLPSRGLGDVPVFPGHSGCTARSTCQTWLRRAKAGWLASVSEHAREALRGRLHRIGYHSQKRSLVRDPGFRALPSSVQGAFVGTDPRTLRTIYDEVTPEDQRAAFEAIERTNRKSPDVGDVGAIVDTTASTTASRRKAGA